MKIGGVIGLCLLVAGYCRANILSSDPAQQDPVRQNTLLFDLLSENANADQAVVYRGVLGNDDPLYYGESSRHFVIRWEFQRYCDHVFDPLTDKWHWPTTLKEGGITFDPSLVEAGDLIFVRNAPLFFETMHPYIKNPYMILTHGDCLESMKKKYYAYLEDPKVIRWFGIHPCKTLHAKFTPIPLGVIQQPENHKRAKELHATFGRLRRTSEKKELLYMNFADFQKPERKKVREMFINRQYCKRGLRQPFESYLKEMSECKFTLSPAGLGPDCYRTWEALLVGSIPIVRKSQLDPLFEGLPVLIIDEWEEIDEEYLNKKYAEIMSRKYDIKRIYMEYWLDKIEAVRSQFLATYK